MRLDQVRGITQKKNTKIIIQVPKITFFSDKARRHITLESFYVYVNGNGFYNA